MNPPVTRYARSGDVRVAYQVTGEGPPDLVLAPGTVSHLELAWEFPPMRRIFEQLTVRGIAVHTAARIASLAEADDVLVSATVRDLTAGSGLRYVDRGVRTLKGVPEEHQLYAVER